MSSTIRTSTRFLSTYNELEKSQQEGNNAQQNVFDERCFIFDFFTW